MMKTSIALEAIELNLIDQIIRTRTTTDSASQTAILFGKHTNIPIEDLEIQFLPEENSKTRIVELYDKMCVQSDLDDEFWTLNQIGISRCCTPTVRKRLIDYRLDDQDCTEEQMLIQQWENRG